MPGEADDLVRFVFSPPAGEAAGLLTLPWELPLEDWRDERLVEIRQRGISRHVVRFVADSGELYALKSISERLARREYRLLRSLAELNVPAVEVVGVVVDRGPGADAILVTRFLAYSSTYRALFSSPRGGQPADRLLDALVELLVRLHLSGFFWGDCSLSNALFRSDAGAYVAYLVDAETSEQHPALTDGQRGWDLELAGERVFGELSDLQAGGLLPPEVETGIHADENQARRLRNDIASFRGYLEQTGGHPVSETVAAHRWLEEVYDPVIVATPADLRGRLSPPEIFHEILEHRWYLSEDAGRDVGTTAAARSYFATVLPAVPRPLASALAAAEDDDAAVPPGP